MTGLRSSNKKDSSLHHVIGEVLHYIWDPIGVAGVPQARDEYDAYVPHVLGLLQAGADESAISDYLQKVSEGRIGLSKLTERADKAASALVDWRDYFSESHA